MDHRHPFSRQPAPPHNLADEPRYNPIPPPPYSSQRQDLPPHNDPFFPRRQQYEPHAASPTKADQSTSYGLPPPPYPLNPFAATHSHSVNDGRTRRGSYEAGRLYDHLRREESESRNGEMQQGDANRLQPIPPPPPPPPPPPSTFHQPFAQQYAQDNTRRNISNGTNQPSMYGRVAEHSPPPPAQFSSRQMLPPTSPQYAQPPYSQHLQTTRGPVPSLPFARDLPALSAVHRPGSSMSISSMLGQASDTPSRNSAPPHRDLLYPAPPTMSVQSPVRPGARGSPPLSAIAGSPQIQRSHTPDSYPSWRADQSRLRAHSGGQQSRSFAVFAEKPQEPLQSEPALASYHGSQTAYESNKAAESSQLDSRAIGPRRSSIGGALHTSAYQQSGFRTPPIEITAERERAPVSPESIRGKRLSNNNQIQSSDLPNHRDAAFEIQRNGGSQGLPYNNTNRTPVQSVSRAPFSSRPDQAPSASLSNYPFLSRSTHHTVSYGAPSQGNQTTPTVPTPDPSSRTGVSNDHSSHTNEVSRFLRDNDRSDPGLRQNSARNPPHLYDLTEEKHMREPTSMSAQMRELQSTSTLERADNNLVGLEGTHQQPRNQLNLVLDNNKRGGRVSPLPQAVQGAQGRMRGPASEPGIKNEFARMFSGIGSGVGSAMSTPVPLENGASLSFPSSPTRVEESERGTPLNSRQDVVEPAKSRVSLKGGRRSRKIKDEDSKMDGDTGEGLTLARSSSGRGTKRVRQSYNLQNLHTNHHHHHVDSPTSSNSFAALKNVKRTFTPTQALAMTPAATPHHHHHHHPPHPPHHTLHHTPHHHHHHHHYPPAATTPVPHPPSRRPTITISSKAVLDSVSDLPRRHLGSSLYSPVLSVPSWKSSHEQLKFGYESTSTPLPRVEGKENCTITIRVPRLYLRREEREEICMRRGLWGSEIYTDDSDPIAAAIHGGWILGEWGEDVDASMLEADPLEDSPVQTKDKDAKDSAEPQTVLTSPPPIPMAPPADRDLHITLLVLPRLQSYASLVTHGIKSRAWSGMHDGVSFMVQKIAWVDEKAGRGEERGGEARRRRLRALMGMRDAGVGKGFAMGAWKREMRVLKAVGVAS